MQTMTIKEARTRIRHAVDLAEQGETVIVTRKGRPAARLCPPGSERPPLPSLKDFRAGLSRPSPGLSESVVAARNQERF